MINLSPPLETQNAATLCLIGTVDGSVQDIPAWNEQLIRFMITRSAGEVVNLNAPRNEPGIALPTPPPVASPRSPEQAPEAAASATEQRLQRVEEKLDRLLQKLDHPAEQLRTPPSGSPGP